MSHSHSKHHARQRRAQFRALWAWPIAMGVLSLFGLLAALLYDGWGDALSWITLGVPVLVMCWFGWMRRR
ncbi:hypothetical protein [Xylophilus sp. ASV27]|uniref:hypothetical protein n=1 Tax=Xylophilus sp. ASV27 TaxID=2795129 RepID=UPI0018ED4EBC|nr:hypothetical protein [Xylophilus sp. ASV27]